jgi:hypothetical protein
VSNQRLGLWDIRPRRTWAFSDAILEDIAYAGYRLIPSVSSETPGSPALLPYPWRNISIGKAMVRLSIS